MGTSEAISKPTVASERASEPPFSQRWTPPLLRWAGANGPSTVASAKVEARRRRGARESVWGSPRGDSPSGRLGAGRRADLRADGNDHPDGARGGARRDHLHGNDHRRQFPEQPPGVLRGRSGRRTRGCGIAHAYKLDRSRRRDRTIGVHRRRAGRRARASDGCSCRPDGDREHCQLQRPRAVRRRAAMAAVCVRPPP